MRSELLAVVLPFAGFSYARVLLNPVSLNPPLATNFPTPQNDPFYTVPANISGYNPGQVIRSRIVHTIEFGSCVNTRQVFYRTNNRLHKATGTVATIFIPAFPASPPKILSYQAPEDALDIRCAPSWANVNSSSEQEAYFADYLKPLVTYALNQGYYFVNADDDGPTSDWLVGVSEGSATLDGVRAGINDLELSNNQTKIALLGYSGGAHETVWAASIAANYAPELNIVSAAYGGTPVDLTSAINLLNGGPFAILAGGALVGLSKGYPDFNTTLTSLMTPEGKALYEKLAGPDACLIESEGNFTHVNFTSSKYFASNPLDDPVIMKVLKQESLLNNVSPFPIPAPKYPRFEWHGTNDTIIPYWSEAAYVQQQCAKGADIAFVTYPGLNHGEAEIAGIPGALVFITHVFENEHVTTPCGANVSTPVLGSNESIKLLGRSVVLELEALE